MAVQEKEKKNSSIDHANDRAPFSDDLMNLLSAFPVLFRHSKPFRLRRLCREWGPVLIYTLWWRARIILLNIPYSYTVYDGHVSRVPRICGAVDPDGVWADLNGGQIGDGEKKRK